MTATRLNIGRYPDRSMPHSCDLHKIPCKWLRANVDQFLFSDDQIVAAAKPQFDGLHWDEYQRFYGIYFLIRSSEIAYVGLSNNVAKRIFQHRANGVCFDAITWFEAPDFYLKDIEAYYIRRIEPPLNTARPCACDFSAIVKEMDCERPAPKPTWRLS